MREWDPTRFFRSDTPPTPFALLVLNQPINERAFAVLREHGACALALSRGQHLILIGIFSACFTVCADGGANWFYDLMQKQGRETTIVR